MTHGDDKIMLIRGLRTQSSQPEGYNNNNIIIIIRCVPTSLSAIIQND